MTPQERQLIDDLFDRLSKLENSPRDAEAEAAIRNGLRRAPNAIYALVQTVLVQDEAHGGVVERVDVRLPEIEEPQQRGERDDRRRGESLQPRDRYRPSGRNRGSHLPRSGSAGCSSWRAKA